jgi:peptidoglycan/xylan/chitin deacetylase (PgdA/CDA1 family)
MDPLISLLFHDVYATDPSESGFNGPVANRYKVSRPAFLAALDALKSAGIQMGTVTRAGLPARDRVLFTVDDGGVSFATEIADALEARGWRGHCFVTTGAIGSTGFLSASDIRDLDRRGHAIGSHSATHPTRFSACSAAAMHREWAESRAALEDLLGHEVRLASLPGGYLSLRAAEMASCAGLRTLFTSEPVRQPWIVDRCTLIGRFTVRADSPPSSLVGLATGRRGPCGRQWLSWNAKKAVKPIFGSAYPRLGAWLAVRRHA